MAEKKKIIKEFLESIHDDIVTIDGGCRPCIINFCEGVDDIIKPIGLSIVYDGELKITEI